MDPRRVTSVPLFASLTNAQRNRLSQWLDEVDVPEGRKLVEAGTFAYEFVVIEDGTANVIVDGRRVNDMGPGDFFGEIGLLAAPRRTATVVATSPMRLIVMTSRSFRSMLDELPEVAEHVRAVAEERLRRAGPD